MYMLYNCILIIKLFIFPTWTISSKCHLLIISIKCREFMTHICLMNGLPIHLNEMLYKTVWLNWRGQMWLSPVAQGRRISHHFSDIRFCNDQVVLLSPPSSCQWREACIKASSSWHALSSSIELNAVFVCFHFDCGVKCRRFDCLCAVYDVATD